MKRDTIILIIVLIVVLGILAFAVYKGMQYFKKFGGKGTGTGSGTQNGTATGGTGPSMPPSTPSVADFNGSWVKAKYNNTKLYNNDLKEVRTYNAGEDIGRLGSEAIGYACCDNLPGFYKIRDTSNVPGGETTGWCNCEVVMSRETLEWIFGINK